MPTKDASYASLFVHPASQPVVLAGAPRDLAGRLLLQNYGQERLTLRSLRLRRLQPDQEAPGMEGEAAPLQLGTVVLEPGQQQDVQINISLSPHTPPGEYPAELDTGDETRPVILQVIESVDLDLEPRELVIDVPAGVTIVKRVVFSNQGNVPLAIGDLGEVLLDDDRHNQRVLHDFLNAVGDETRTLDEYAAELLRQSRRVVEEAGALQVRCVGGAFQLEPGATQAVDLEIVLPPGLAAHRRYRGRAAIYTQSLDFVVVPAAVQTVKNDTQEQLTRRGRRGK